uniref:SDR family NAD(P)-dependent oxidoreductase n=1 Tax=Altererythrobacter segetis TaxID=1104773 RepID=UPI00140E6B33|nr:SDR family NAD(P)-dependent oxidoreductase [Altererythrobacter segetis]
MRSFDGKWVAITGAAGGIGYPVSRLLRRYGARTLCIDRIAVEHCDRSIVADLADDGALRDLCRQLAADPPDILINVAGVMRFGLHETQPLDAVALCYRINLGVPAALAAAVAGPMRTRGSGHIVNIGSVLGSIPYPWFAAYSSSKAGLAGLSQALRRELAGSGVAVTHINPRAARTAFNTGEVERFLKMARMKADEPDWVARRIVETIASRKAHLSIGAMERVYAALNALVPAVIDNGLKSQVRRARAAFS